MFVLAQHFDAEGNLVRLLAKAEGGVTHFFRDDQRLGTLPAATLRHILARYGRALDPEAATVPGPLSSGESGESGESARALEVGDGLSLLRWDYQALVDVEPKAYLVWHPHGGEAQCALATMVGAAVQHLLSVASQRTKSASP